MQRLGLAVVISLAAWFLSPSIWPLIWFGCVVLTQVLEHTVIDRPVAAGRVELTRAFRAMVIGVTGFNAAIYVSLSVFLWFLGPPGQMFSIMLICGTLFHVCLNLYTVRVVQVAGAIAPVALLFGLPIIGSILSGGIGVAAICIMLLAATLYLVQLLIGVVDSHRINASLRAANAEAERQKQEAEVANLAKSAFLANMSHEIRTPLNAVLGIVQVLAAGRASPVQRSNFEIIRQSGETLLAVLSDIIDVSKIEAGQMELEDRPFDLGELAIGSQSAFAGMACEKGLSFEFNIDPAAQGVYRGDRARVRQILSNLISNALKFTEVGGVQVSIDRLQGMLQLRVTDSGIGIEPGRLDDVFSPFVQVDTSATRSFGGSGLGLSICRNLAVQMGGDIKVESTPGKGSMFLAILPLVAVEPDAASSTVEPRLSSDTPNVAPLRMLAAEDNPVNQRVLRMLLQQADIEPVMVADGALAVKAWESQDWDVILMDVQMPNLDGIAAARAIRAREKVLARPRTPILAVTANVMTHQIEEYLAAGMDGVVAKPIQISRLFDAINLAIDGPDPRGVDPAAIAAA